MLNKKHRLRLEKDIKTLFAKGKGVFGICIGIKYRKNNLEDSRFTVVVGTKVSKKAVERNRLKRQIRAVIRKNIDSFVPGYDFVFFGKKESLNKDTKEIEKQILSVLKKTILLK
jgi:ribonuclease P protein component